MSKDILHSSLASQIGSSRKAVDDLYKQLNAKEDYEVKEGAEDVRIASIVLAAMSKIPIPKDGKNGVSGKDGTRGINGARGFTGNTGDTGAPGKDGINGTDGIDGRDGKDGKDGIGVSGTRGLDGTDGKDGKDGVDGAKGADGSNGLDGTNGVSGKDGLQGLPGKDGTNGIDGRDGLHGLEGKKGVHGSDGKKGKDGTNGKPGAKGSNGKDGKDGRGIKDVTVDGSVLKFTLSDGKSKKVKLPTSNVVTGRSSGAVQPDTFQRAVRVPFDNTKVETDAVNVQDAVVEVILKQKELEECGTRVYIDREVKVSEGCQKVIFDTLELLNTYVVEGDLILEV